MDKRGFPTFTLIGHDRGGRVSYRMALDHPKNVERLAVFDVIPTLEAWSRSDARFAQTYWPWILLSQKDPLPEKYLLGAPEAVFHNPFGQGFFAQRFSKNTSPPIATRPAFTESARSIERQRRLMSNTIARTKNRRTESNAPCCTYGPKAVRSTLSMEKKAVRSEFGGNGLHAPRDKR
jgi:pimeloyl-ACP methyl ester carboxylesterase